MAPNDKKTDDYHITRPPTQSRSQAFFQFLYNPRTHEVLGRTAKSWRKLLFDYFITIWRVIGLDYRFFYVGLCDLFPYLVSH